MMSSKDEWSLDPDSYEKERKIYIANHQDATIAALASNAKLELGEFKYWGEVIQYKKHSETKQSYPYKVSVPNVWIVLDALRGGNWLWDKPFVNPGGDIGAFFSTDMFTYGKKIERFDCVRKLAEFLATPNKRKNIWGMIIFAHGDKDGYIGDKRGEAFDCQMRLIYELEKNHYRLAHTFIMQCFSGYKGRANGEFDDEYVARCFSNVENFKIDGISEKGYLIISYDIDWEAEWYRVSLHVFPYKHMNILMVDLDIFIRGFNVLRKGINGISGLFQKVN